MQAGNSRPTAPASDLASPTCWRAPRRLRSAATGVEFAENRPALHVAGTAVILAKCRYRKSPGRITPKPLKRLLVPPVG